MAELVNIKTGEIVSVPDVQAVDLLGKGFRQATQLDVRPALASTPEPTDINVVGPYGVGGTLPKEQIEDASSLGYRPETRAETDERVLQQKYGDQYGRTIGEGLLRGFTLGVSDMYLAGQGRESAEGLRERRERVSELAFASELGGNLALSVVLPGAGIAGGATGGGAAVARYAPVLARSAGEGALFGAGQGVSAAALSEHPMGAEAVLAEIGSGALLGAGVGVALGAGGKFLSDATNAARAHVRRATTRTIADDVIATATPRVANKVDDGLERIASRPPRQNSSVESSLKSEQERLFNEAQGIAADIDNAASVAPVEVPRPKPGDLSPSSAAEFPPGWRDFDNDIDNVYGGKKVSRGIPTWEQLHEVDRVGRSMPLRSPELYIVPLDDIERAGLYSDKSPYNSPKQIEAMRQEFRRGDSAFSDKKVPPVELWMAPDGTYHVYDGNHRLQAALAEGSDRDVVALIRPTPKDARPGGSEYPLKWSETRTPSGSPGAVDNGVIEEFKTKYHRQDTASRQQIRQMEGLEAKGYEITPEMRQAADDLETARRRMREFLPLEKERSYEVVDSGPRGGYANKQGKSLQTWVGTNEEIAAAVRKPGFREALLDHQEAMDNMQGLLGNQAYPPVIGGEHPIFAKPVQSTPLKMAPGPAKVAEMEKLGARYKRIEEILSKEAKSKADLEFMNETVRLAESRGMVLSESQLNQLVKEAGLPGATIADLPPEAVTRLKADAYSRMAREQLAAQKAAARAEAQAAKKAAKEAEKEAARPKTPLGDLIGNTVAEKVATVAGGAIGSAVGVGPWAGGLLGRSLLGGPLRRITEGMAGKAAGTMEKLAKGVDSFLGGAAKVARSAPRGTTAILNAVSYATNHDDEKVKGTPFEKRAAELNAFMADPMAARQAIHDSLSGVRTADASFGDQLEELAFNRMLFLAEKLPKMPVVGSQFGKVTDWSPPFSEQAKFARYVQAAESPGTVLESMADGSLTSEEVETLQTLYPATYDAVRQDLILKAGELQVSLPWDKKVLLSTLFQAPVDSLLSPESIGLMQSMYVVPAGNTPTDTGSQSSTPAPATDAQRMAG